jgi:hypothetical protein
MSFRYSCFVLFLLAVLLLNSFVIAQSPAEAKAPVRDPEALAVLTKTIEAAGGVGARLHHHWNDYLLLGRQRSESKSSSIWAQARRIEDGRDSS